MVEQFVVNIKSIKEYDNIKSLAQYVSIERQNLIEKYIFDKNKQQSLTAELLLRYVLRTRYGIEQRHIEFEYGKYGKPYLKAPYNDIYFNLSHSNDFVVCGVGSSNVGIDIEQLKNRNLTYVNGVLSENEKSKMNHMDIKERTRMFFKLWTLKESYSKYEGKGLMIPFDQLSFEIEGNHILLYIDGKRDTLHYFCINEIEEEYYIALCVDQCHKKCISKEPIIITFEDLIAI